MSNGYKFKTSQIQVALQSAITLVKMFATTPEQKQKLEALDEAVKKLDKRKVYTLNADFLTTCKSAVSDYITVGYKTQSPDQFLNELLNNVGGVEIEPEQSADDTRGNNEPATPNDGGQGRADQNGDDTERGSNAPENSPSNGRGNLPKDDSAFSNNSGSSENNPGRLEQFFDTARDIYNKGKDFVENNKAWFIGGATAVATGASVLGMYGLKKTSHPSLKTSEGITESGDFDKLISSLKGDAAMNSKAGDVLAAHLNVNTVNGAYVNEDGTRDNMRYNLVYLDSVGENFSEILRFRYNNDTVNVVVGYSVNDQLWVNLSN